MKPLLSFTLALLATAVSAAPVRFVSTGLDYSTGTYGGSTRSETYAANLAFDHEFGPVTLGISRAYLRVTNPGVSIPGIGPVQQETLTRLATSNPRLTARLARYNAATATTTPDETAEGFGDTFVHSTYTFNALGDTGWVPSLTAEVKFGTGDTDKGLGTGETDYSVSARLGKNFGGSGLNFNTGYQFLGDPDGLDLNDGVFVSISVWRDLTDDDTLAAGADWSAASSSEVDAAASLFARYTHRFTETAALSLGLGTGLTDSSADFSCSLGFDYAF